MNVSKSKVMLVSKNEEYDVDVVLKGERLERDGCFRCLGADVHSLQRSICKVGVDECQK